MVGFAGWDMPLQFTGVVAEHTAVRERVGLFDVSHLGKLVVEGAGAAAVLDRVVTGNIRTLEPWRARYNLVLTDEGGIADDLFIYRRPESYLVVPNAANTATVQEAIQSAISEAGGGAEAVLSDARTRWAILALQGPAARAMAEELLPGAVDLRLHGFADFDLGGAAVQVARTGYTGEYGFELFVPWDQAPGVWHLLLRAGANHGIAPVGLGARDTLRLEMGYPLHGHEIGEATNPVEAGLSWAVDWAKPAFTGKAAIEAVRAGAPGRHLVGLVARGPGIPRAGQAILTTGTAAAPGTAVGELTSGNFSPTLGVGVALGYIDDRDGGGPPQPGTMLDVDVRGRLLPVVVTKPPFVARGRAAAAGPPAS
jgi:aminomethyltransferase